jgi:hypothetical protein
MQGQLILALSAVGVSEALSLAPQKDNRNCSSRCLRGFLTHKSAFSPPVCAESHFPELGNR